jgi:anaerobic selenocysteine-containing dehydrogenase
MARLNRREFLKGSLAVAGAAVAIGGTKECFIGENAQEANKLNRKVCRKGFEVPEKV